MNEFVGHKKNLAQHIIIDIIVFSVISVIAKKMLDNAFKFTTKRKLGLDLIPSSSYSQLLKNGNVKIGKDKIYNLVGFFNNMAVVKE